VYKELLPPCNRSCPIGENIQEWLSLAEEKQYREAWQVLVQANPFPSCTGRACYHFCEKGCNRAQFDETVNIHGVERFLGDLALRERWPFPKPASASGKKVSIVGAGPSGLSVAYHLAQQGHSVTVYDRFKEAGGLMRYGVPSYRLPRDILCAEIQKLVNLGITIRLDTEVTDLSKLQAESDACYLALGAWKPRGIPGCEGERVQAALGFLCQEETGSRLSGTVAVYGGGNTAFDAARTALRRGAARVVVLYRNTQERLSAHPEEVALALQEGVDVLPLRVVTGCSGDGQVTLELQSPGQEGKVAPSSTTETLAVTLLLVAIGQEVESTLWERVVQQEGGRISVDRHFATNVPGIFAGGDMVPSGRTITEAIGHGRRAALALTAYLEGKSPPVLEKREGIPFERLNLHYYEQAPQRQESRNTPEGRPRSFQEIFATFPEETALYEARRCLSCGNCFRCDTCYGVCPDNAVCKGASAKGAKNGLMFDYDYCKGCGLCAQECPCGCIHMIPEYK
jgi:NADPH-dependent glutamate synthase beta subunit-like oxidoreductase